jgi:cell division protein FtsN
VRADYRPARQRPRPPVRSAANPDDDYGDVFEDEAPRVTRRASARDYNQAYRDAEEGYGLDERRSAGPWILLGLLLLAAITAGALVWYYQTQVKTASPGAQSGEVPVVTAPEQPAKTAAEPPPETSSAASTEIPATESKKQIYDRIVGDREVLGGQIVPTEEPPVPPPVQPEQSGDAAPVNGNLPQPAAGEGAAGEDTVPLPLPPPPGEGSAPQNNTQGQQGQLNVPVPAPAGNATVEAASALPEPPAPPESASASAPVPTPAPEVKPEEALVIDNGQEGSATAQEAAPPPKPVRKVAAKQKTKAKAKPKPAPEPEVSAAEPLVLVPPAGTGTTAETPQVVNPVTPAPKKKRTLLDLLRGNRSDANEQGNQPARQQVAGVDPDQQVGSLPAPPKPAPAARPEAAPQPQPAGGYIAQLASFRTQAEATREWNRVKSKHAGIIGGLSPRISQATVAGSTRYRLGVGPVADRAQASQICDSLLAAGERDCIVRAQ